MLHASRPVPTECKPAIYGHCEHSINRDLSPGPYDRKQSL